jgi:DNA-binding LacI/PurR family transcriptional regulator
MRRPHFLAANAIAIAVLVTHLNAQEKGETLNLVEVKGLVEQGLFRTYKQHYGYRQNVDGRPAVTGFEYLPNLLTNFSPTDYFDAGRVAADTLIAAMKTKNGKPEGIVVVIDDFTPVTGAEQRSKGFKDQIGKYPGLSLAVYKASETSAGTAGLNIATNLIVADSKLRGIFAPSLLVAQGAAQAIVDQDVIDRINLVAFSEDNIVKFTKQASLSNSYALKFQKKGDTASGVVVDRTTPGMISVDVTPCGTEKEVVTFEMPYKETQINSVSCGNGNSYQQSQVIQE